MDPPVAATGRAASARARVVVAASAAAAATRCVSCSSSPPLADISKISSQAVKTAWRDTQLRMTLHARLRSHGNDDS